MTERQLYKKAYKFIFEEGHDHQEMYDLEHIESGLGPETVARTLSMVPSKTKYASIKGLWMTFGGTIALSAILRLIVILQNDQMDTFGTASMIFAGLLIVVAPILGIYGTFAAKPTLFGLASVTMLVGIIQGFATDDLGTSSMKYIIIVLYAAAIIMGGMIPRKLRMAYTKHVIDKEKEGKIVKRITYTFDEEKSMSRKEIFKENF